MSSDLFDSASRYQMPEVEHFFSYHTGVSLELPVGWEKTHVERNEVTYTDLLDDQGDYIAQFTIQQIKSVSSPEHYKSIARTGIQKNASGHTYKRERQNIQVDGLPGIEIINEYWLAEASQKVVQYQVFTQKQAMVYIFTGVGPQIYQKAVLAIFRFAISTVRFIPLELLRD